MQTLDMLNPQFVTDAEGRQTAVLLSIESYRQILSDLSALGGDIAEADWLKAASRSAVFADLRDSAEDVYSADDGVPFQP